MNRNGSTDKVDVRQLYFSFSFPEDDSLVRICLSMNALAISRKCNQERAVYFGVCLTRLSGLAQLL